MPSTDITLTIALWALEFTLVAAFVLLILRRTDALGREEGHAAKRTGSDGHRNELKQYLPKFLMYALAMSAFPFLLVNLLLFFSQEMRADRIGLSLSLSEADVSRELATLVFVIDQTLKGFLFDLFEVYGINVGMVDVKEQTFATKTACFAYRLIISKITLDTLSKTASVIIDFRFGTNFAGLGGRKVAKRSDGVLPVFRADDSIEVMPISASPVSAPGAP